MFTLTNDTLSRLSSGAGAVVVFKSTQGQSSLFSRVNTTLEGQNGTSSQISNIYETGLRALFRYLTNAVEQQAEQAYSEGYSLRRFGSMAAYCFSMYGFTTFIISLILNRTTAIASSSSVRRPLAASRNRYVSVLRQMPLSQDTILKLLRFSAVILLSAQVGNVLVVLRIIAENHSPSLTSRLSRLVPAYFEYDPVVYADDPYMKMSRKSVSFGPTSDMLWPLYLTVAYSVFVETFASAIRNKRPLQGAGITLFELSLAIQEMTVEYSFLGGSNSPAEPTESLLLICLFALMEQISNQLGDVFYANKYRLVPSTILNSFFIWYFVAQLGEGFAFSFPGSIILSYFGLVLTLWITVICFAIFVLALVTKGARFDELNYSSFFDQGHEDYEFFTKHLNLSWSQDFYTAAINLGMIAVSSAGKSSYMTAYSILALPGETWLDRSVWNRLSAAFDTSALMSESPDSRRAKLSIYLRENGISGYGNVTTTPTLSMINGSDNEIPQKLEPSLRVRFLYLRETLSRFGQLLVWPFVRLFNNVWYRKLSHDPECSALKDAQTPPFLRHLVEEQEPVDLLDLNEIDEDELEEKYALLLSGTQFAEDDESPDYIDGEEDSDVESDVDLLDLTETTATGFTLNELMTTENLLELVQDRDVLEKHLRNEKGVMTRSHFQTASGHYKAQDEMQKLINIMVEKRQRDVLESKAGLDDNECRMGHLACVVCQTEPREIVTWPCKCFSICESCRLSLVAKGMEGCVCCRRDVEGVSRVFLP